MAKNRRSIKSRGRSKRTSSHASQRAGASARLLNREIGLLAFNERVLELADDESTPLLERLRFLAIVSNNIDELFEVRVAELRELALAERSDAASTRASLRAIALRAGRLVHRQYRLLNTQLIPQLARQGIVFLSDDGWSDKERRWAETYFQSEVEPLLTPIALDPAHPFPRLLNKSLTFVIELDGHDSFGRRAGLAVLQAPRALPRVLHVPDVVSGTRDRLMLLSTLIEVFVEQLFPGLEVLSMHQFRVTRNSELFVDDEEITDLRAALQGELPQRHYGDAVRLEVSAGCPDAIVARLLAEFGLEHDDCYRVDGPVNLSRLSQVPDLLGRHDLKYPLFEPALPKRLRDRELFAAIRGNDVLIHHPYESFVPVMDFLESAARDPDVVAIKQTVYRTGSESVLMESLVAAARAGKEVTVVVELLARFDEEANINWAAQLEYAGAHVVYGVVGRKTHAKMALVIRREKGKLRRYAHLGTGNYHARTARLYEDFGMFSADEDICADVQEVFRRLTGLGQAGALRVLLQSPLSLHEGVLDAIRRETRHAKAGRPAYVAAKVNALLEPIVIDALYEASNAGVKVDLIVRGVCALRPGVPGLSENIRVRSVIGRFLEHSRVFYFHNDGADDVWLSSADWMDRNLLRRVEVAFPVRDKRLKKRVIEEAIVVHLRDNAFSWVMDSDGGYERRRARDAKPIVSQQVLLSRLAHVTQAKPPEP